MFHVELGAGRRARVVKGIWWMLFGMREMGLRGIWGGCAWGESCFGGYLKNDMFHRLRGAL